MEVGARQRAEIEDDAEEDTAESEATAAIIGLS